MSSANSGAFVRAEAAKAVNAVVSDGRSLDVALADAEQSVDPDDHALLRNICYGSIRWHWQLQFWLSQLLSKPLRARDSVINALLSTGLYQMAYMRVPDHAAVSMTVEAARILRQPKFVPMINAVLRNFRRKKIEDIPPPNEEVRFSHPEWLIEKIRTDWPDDWQAILEANNERAPMWLRVNGRRQSNTEFRVSLGLDRDDEASDLPGVPSAIRLPAPIAVNDLAGFATGEVTVQDAAAQIAATWLLESGDRGPILDACAAPGGKTGHLLELGGTESPLTAIDVDEQRLQLVGDNLQRLGFAAELTCADAADTDAWWDGEPFQHILLDAPCSASGVIRRHPDIKLLRRSSDIKTLAAVQKRLLRSLWPLLAPGGRLLYVTCSVLTEENDQQIDEFLQHYGATKVSKVLPNNNIRDLMRATKNGFQVLPGTDGLDGFYFACLHKVTD